MGTATCSREYTSLSADRRVVRPVGQLLPSPRAGIICDEDPQWTDYRNASATKTEYRDPGKASACSKAQESKGDDKREADIDNGAL